MEGEVARILDQLQREHEGDPWHGSPLRTLLAGIIPEVAAARPIRNVHSVWEIVLHMTAWKNEVRCSGADGRGMEGGARSARAGACRSHGCHREAAGVEAVRAHERSAQP
jgi:hypothetical protein